MSPRTDERTETAYYADGRVKFTGAYLDGEMHGAWEWYRTDGTLMRSGSFDRGRQIASPGSQSAAAGEVFVTTVLARMMHRVLVENWEAEKAVEEAHKKVVEIYARWPEG